MVKHSVTYMGGRQIRADMKCNVDHSTLDFDFFVAKAKNDAQLVPEMVAVREAKKELRDFEATMHQDLPK